LSKPAFVKASYLAERTGLTARYFTGKAAEGQIPGAHQPSGPGGAWRFNEQKFWKWWAKKERKPDPWCPPYTPRVTRAPSNSADELRKLLGMPPKRV
jgi:hypothetical protein